MVVYVFRQLKVHQRTYPSHDLELAVVVSASKLWRHYLYSVHVDVYTDHKSLQYFFTQRELNLLQSQLLELLKDYNMSVLYHPGKDNVVANSLSRMTMGSVAHVEGQKKDIVKYVHRLARLGVRLEESLNVDFMVRHISESSLVVEVISKQHLDKPLMELKESVLGNLNDSFSLGEGWYL